MPSVLLDGIKLRPHHGSESRVSSFSEGSSTVRIPFASVESAGTVLSVIEGASGAGKAPAPSSVTHRWTAKLGLWRPPYFVGMKVSDSLQTAYTRCPRNRRISLVLSTSSAIQMFPPAVL